MKKWAVKYVDDELEDEQVAWFGSREEALTWIKNIEVQERYDPTGFEVVDGPCLADFRSNDIQAVLESCTIAAGQTPCRKCQFGECNAQELGIGDFAYDAVNKSLRSGMKLEKVVSSDGRAYSAFVTGIVDGSQLDRKAWIQYLQDVEQLASSMIDNYGVASVWLEDFSNDRQNGKWSLEIGFDLLSSPFDDNK